MWKPWIWRFSSRLANTAKMNVFPLGLDKYVCKIQSRGFFSCEFFFFNRIFDRVKLNMANVLLPVSTFSASLHSSTPDLGRLKGPTFRSWTIFQALKLLVICGVYSIRSYWTREITYCLGINDDASINKALHQCKIHREKTAFLMTIMITKVVLNLGLG